MKNEAKPKHLGHLLLGKGRATSVQWGMSRSIDIPQVWQQGWFLGLAVFLTPSGRRWDSEGHGSRVLEALLIEQPKPVWEEGMLFGMHTSPQEQIIATGHALRRGRLSGCTQEPAMKAQRGGPPPQRAVHAPFSWRGGRLPFKWALVPSTAAASSLGL